MIKAIETWYKGYHFRSRLEARWAVFFDTLGVRWNYELEGYILDDGTHYLPDFWLPDLNAWYEVKGTFDDFSERKISQMDGTVYVFGNIPEEEVWTSADGTKHYDINWADAGPRKLGGLIFESTWVSWDALETQYLRYLYKIDPDWCPENLTFEEYTQHDRGPDLGIIDFDKLRHDGGYRNSGWDMGREWCQCWKCGAIGIEFEGRIGRLPCGCARDGINPFTGKWHKEGRGWPSPDIVKALNAARSARFEFGETPDVQASR